MFGLLLSTRLLWLLPLLFLPAQLAAADAVAAGEFIVERPTLICLGFEWKISGDDNRNATVEVRYRKAGESAWKQGMPLLRIGGEKVYRHDLGLDYTVPEGFAGSILDLEPDTEYEARFELRDPDGVQGEAVKTVRVRTRGEPKAGQGGRVLHVYPPQWEGEKQEPSFVGLKSAYYGSGRGDWAVVSERKAQPGDIILVHAGLYKSDRLNYSDPLGLPFDGTYALTLKGTPAKPIVIRAAGDGEVIFDGDGAHHLFDVMATEYHIFEGLTIRNADVAFYAGRKDIGGATGLTVRNCRFEQVGVGVVTEYAGSHDFYIADNIMLGRDDQHRLLGWFRPGIYGAHPLKSFFGVKVYGSGHVIAHNYIAYFHDGICISTYGSPEKEQDRKAVSIDIYNNDIHLMADDFIEADGGVHNIRILRNRGVNAAQCGLSAQPVYGGPAYYIRNVAYHVPTGCALKFNVKPAGLVLYHNTILSENNNGQIFSNGHFRNNLFLGPDKPGRGIYRFGNATSYSTYDYNGYRPNPKSDWQYDWRAPRPGEMRNYDERLQPVRYRTLAELNAATGQEKHGVEVDFDIFENLRAPDPDDPHAVYHARNLNFRLKPGSKAVDAGVAIPNVNENHSGRAPDLGALETGQPDPVYGPRPARPR
jgi:hypothetical protein